MLVEDIYAAQAKIIVLINCPTGITEREVT